MYLCLGFSFEAARLLVREQGFDSLERLRVFADRNIDNICNAMIKPGGKNANGKPNRGQEVSVMAKENLKLLLIPSLVEMHL